MTTWTPRSQSSEYRLHTQEPEEAVGSTKCWLPSPCWLGGTALTYLYQQRSEAEIENGLRKEMANI